MKRKKEEEVVWIILIISSREYSYYYYHEDLLISNWHESSAGRQRPAHGDVCPRMHIMLFALITPSWSVVSLIRNKETRIV